MSRDGPSPDAGVPRAAIFRDEPGDGALTYDELRSHIETVLITGAFAKADVFISHINSDRFVVKDFGNKGFLERNIIGRLLISRETRAYRALVGLEGLPKRFFRISPYALAIEYLEGTDLGRVDRGEIGPGVIRRFETIVEELHERGWVHLDLQRRSNILVAGGKVYVVDLASAFRPGGVPLLGRPLTRLLGFFDRLSLIKVKSIYAPEMLTPRERKWLSLRNLVMPRKW